MREEKKTFARLFRKRWVVPTVYLLSAALILTGVLWFQSRTNDVVQPPVDDSKQSTAQKEEEAIPVQQTVEQIAMPVLDPNAVEIAKPFYDFNASAEQQEAALVSYNDEYYPNKGVDITMKNGESFDVVASLSGTVVKAEKDPLFGYVVQLEHDNGVVTVYQSLTDVKVNVGDAVKQGQMIAKAGTSEFNKESGVHVHFEIRKDGRPVNPVAYFDQPVTALTEQSTEQSTDEREERTNPSSTVPDASIGMART